MTDHLQVLSDWLSRTQVLHNPLQLWLYAAAAMLIGYLVTHTVLHTLANHLRKRAHAGGHPHRLALSLLGSTSRWMILALAIVLASTLLDFPKLATRWLDHAGFAVVALQIALWANALIKLWMQRADKDTSSRRINPVLGEMLT